MQVFWSVEFWNSPGAHLAQTLRPFAEANVPGEANRATGVNKQTTVLRIWAKRRDSGRPINRNRQ